MNGLLADLLNFVPPGQRTYLFGSTPGGAATANPQMLLRSPEIQGVLSRLLYYHPNMPRGDDEDPRRKVLRAEGGWKGLRFPDTQMNNLYQGPLREYDIFDWAQPDAMKGL